MKPPSVETQSLAAHECLADLPASDLAKRLVEAQARALDLESKLDEQREYCLEVERTIEAATAVLQTLVQPIGGRDLLTHCEIVRTELRRLRKEAKIPF